MTLPVVVLAKLPLEITRHIYRFIPNTPAPKKTHPAGLQRALETLQKSPKRNSMDLYGLDDFVLS